MTSCPNKYFSFILVCRKRLDLAFLIDGSGSINAYGRGNFRRCLNFVKRLVASFSISPRKTRVGIILFSTRAWLIANFRRYRNKQSLLRAIGRIRYPRGGTNIGRALNFARYRLFRRRTNRRKVSLDEIKLLFYSGQYYECINLRLVLLLYLLLRCLIKPRFFPFESIEVLWLYQCLSFFSNLSHTGIRYKAFSRLLR